MRIDAYRTIAVETVEPGRTVTVANRTMFVSTVTVGMDDVQIAGWPTASMNHGKRVIVTVPRLTTVALHPDANESYDIIRALAVSRPVSACDYDNTGRVDLLVDNWVLEVNA